MAPHIFLLSQKLYKVESVHHRAPYSRSMSSKRLHQQKGDTARIDIAQNRVVSNVREGQKIESSAKTGTKNTVNL